MREIINDLNLMEDQPDGSIRVPLGREGRTPGLEGLADGEQVLIIHPFNLAAEAIVQSAVHEGRRYWYAILPGLSAIRDIDPDSPANQSRAAVTGSERKQ